MKKLNFDIIFKVIIMISLVYSLFLLTVIANNSSNGRYQYTGGYGTLDTKTGKFFEKGVIYEWSKGNDTIKY